MPYHSPHRWSLEQPPTSSGLYGYASRDYTPLPVEDPCSKLRLVQKPKPDLTYVGVMVPRREHTKLPAVNTSLPAGAMQRSHTWAPGSKGGFVPFERQQEDRYKQVIQKQRTDLLRQLEKATGRKQLLEPSQLSETRLRSPCHPPPPRRSMLPRPLRDTYLWHINAGYLVNVEH